MARKSGEDSNKKDRAPKRKGKNFYNNKKQNDNNGNSKDQIFDDCNEDNSTFNDTASIISGISNVSRYDFDNDNTLNNSGGQEELDDNECENDFENSFAAKLSKVIDELQTTKSTKERLRYYELLSNAFITKYCAEEYLENRKFTFQDIIEHGLKRGGDEAGFAAQILSLILITLGDTIYCDELFRLIYDMLERNLMNPVAKPLIRSKCATALSLGCFVTNYGLEKTQNLMNKLLLIIFSNVKSDPETSTMAELNALKVCALDAFNFLMTLNIESNQLMVNCIQPNMGKLVKCLESNHLELRVAAGECFALLFENCMDDDRTFSMYNIDELKEKLEILATDSQKYRSKKELRTQRSNFRQILRTIEGEDYDSETIKFGNECLVLDCWKLKCYYNTICSVLGTGMNLHLSQNQTLRDIFDLGPILDTCRKSINNNKKYLKNANRKYREVNRLKQREKRGDYYSEL